MDGRLLLCVLALAVASSVAVVWGAGEEGHSAARKAVPAGGLLLERIKMAALERRWEEALADTEEFLRRFPSAPGSAWALLYRGRALAAVGGRDIEALESFARSASGAGEERELAEEARRSACRVASTLAAAGRAEGITAMSRALADPSRPVRIYAAVLASRLEAPALLGSAGEVLRKELGAEPNPDLRDEMTLALARIDPALLPPTEARDGARRKGGRATVRWIHLRITRRSRPQEKVSVNLPVSFARALLDALPSKSREEIRRQAESQGLSWEALSTALDQLGASGLPLLQADDGDESFEVWVD